MLNKLQELKIQLEDIRKKYKDSDSLDQQFIRMYEERGISNPVN